MIGSVLDSHRTRASMLERSIVPLGHWERAVDASQKRNANRTVDTSQVAPLLQTVKALLRRSTRGDAAFVCGFVCRATTTRDLFMQTADELGFVVLEVEHDAFLPTPRPANIFSQLPLVLLELRLRTETTARRDETTFFLESKT